MCLIKRIPINLQWSRTIMSFQTNSNNKRSKNLNRKKNKSVKKSKRG